MGPFFGGRGDEEKRASCGRRMRWEGRTVPGCGAVIWVGRRPWRGWDGTGEHRDNSSGKLCFPDSVSLEIRLCEPDFISPVPSRPRQVPLPPKSMPRAPARFSPPTASAAHTPTAFSLKLRAEESAR